MAKLCLLSDQSLVGQSRTPRANSTEARRDEDVHRLVSDVEQLIGIHADDLFREPDWSPWLLPRSPAGPGRDRVRQWCDTEVAPAAAGYWERAEFPVELAKGYGRLGIAGASIVGNGCPGVSFLAEGVIAAELARGDGSIATLNAVHSGLAMTTIAMLGSEEQQAQYLPRMATCEILGAFALTEPKHGSDVVALETRARRQGDEWVLDGHKRWIGNGTVADVVVVWARDDDGQVGAFVVEHPDGAEHPVPGYHARKIVGKAANRGVWQAQIRLDGVRVPAGARLRKARTWDDTNYVLAKSRQTVAWAARCRRIGARRRHCAIVDAADRPYIGQLVPIRWDGRHSSAIASNRAETPIALG